MSSSRLYEQFRNRWSTEIGYRLIGIRPEDRFISAYPRSGSTWLRTMLTNILVADAFGRPEVFNRVIPAVSIRNSRFINALEVPRLIMTHGLHQPAISKCVYVVRDGRDVLVSYYHYVTTRTGRKMGFPEFYDRYLQEAFGSTWCDHTLSWCSAIQSGRVRSSLVVHFEELKQSTPKILATVCEFLDIPHCDKSIGRAIRQASLPHAKMLEEIEHGRKLGKNESFYRSGDSGIWRSELSDELVQRLVHDMHDGLELAGYL